MLLLVDLDNTVVDRASAFSLWATEFVRSLGGTAAEVIDAVILFDASEV